MLIILTSPGPCTIQVLGMKLPSGDHFVYQATHVSLRLRKRMGSEGSGVCWPYYIYFKLINLMDDLCSSLLGYGSVVYQGEEEREGVKGLGV